MAQSHLADVAARLVEHCRAGTERAALDTLYDPDAVSVESCPMPGTHSAEQAGLQAIRAKHAWWEETMKVHSTSVDGPYLHGPHGDGEDRFAVIFEVDATERATDKRFQMKEVAVYTVREGRIVREEFFSRA
jgi:ketosteroid isomerase-like protein